MQALPPTGTFLWVDVRDVALAHMRAIQVPEAGNKRFFVVAGHCSSKYKYQTPGTQKNMRCHPTAGCCCCSFRKEERKDKNKKAELTSMRASRQENL